jgi:hypothetical protein
MMLLDMKSSSEAILECVVSGGELDTAGSVFPWLAGFLSLKKWLLL